MTAIFVDDRGTQVWGPFDDATSFEGGYAAVKIGDQWGFIDARGRIVVEPRFAKVGEMGSGVAVIRDGAKAGYFDIASARWLVEPRFDFALGFVGDYASVVMGGEIPDWAASFQTRPDGGKWGVIDRSGQIVIPIDRGHARVHDGIAYVNEGGRASAWGHASGGRNYFVDLATNARIGDDYAYASLFGEGLACVQTRANSKEWRIIDRAAAEVGRIDSSLEKFAPPEPFSQGRAVVSPQGKTSHRSKYAFITSTGSVAAADLGEAHAFCDGLAAVNRGGEKVQGECRKGTWGFLALDGSFVTRPEWVETSAFSEGRGIARAKNEYLVVDRAGDTVFSIPFWIAPYANGVALVRRRA